MKEEEISLEELNKKVQEFLDKPGVRDTLIKQSKDPSFIPYIKLDEEVK